MKGEVIGINNSIASNGGGNEGVGFSIPINLARWIMNQLIDQGPGQPRGARDRPPPRVPPRGRRRRWAWTGPQGAWVDVVHPARPPPQAGLQTAT